MKLVKLLMLAILSVSIVPTAVRGMESSRSKKCLTVSDMSEEDVAIILAKDYATSLTNILSAINEFEAENSTIMESEIFWQSFGQYVVSYSFYNWFADYSFGFVVFGGSRMGLGWIYF